MKKTKNGMRMWNWMDERFGLSAITRFLKNKPIPMHKHTIWSYTGSAVLLFFVLQILTGFMLIFYYNPTLEGANASVARIMTEVPLGWILRSVHSWSATFMIAILFVHLLSIWISKAYRRPREMTWMTGVLLLFCSLLFGFTGYLLPWDDLSFSATKVGTDIPRAIPVVGEWVTKLLRGGEDVTGDTLTRFFGIHVCILPLVLLLLLAVHVYLIQKLGMSIPLEAERSQKKLKNIPFWPNFVFREAILWLILFGVCLTVAIFFPPSLDKSADLMAPAPEGIKPEWYFLFLFQTLKIFPAKILFLSGEFVAVFLIFIGMVLFFFLPVIDNKPEEKKGKIVKAAAFLFILYAMILSIWSLM
ncbi:cytochrome bc complex cytochrome b subunit [Acidobacteriota bacterium]